MTKAGCPLHFGTKPPSTTLPRESRTAFGASRDRIDSGIGITDFSRFRPGNERCAFSGFATYQTHVRWGFFFFRS